MSGLFHSPDESSPDEEHGDFSSHGNSSENHPDNEEQLNRPKKLPLSPSDTYFTHFLSQFIVPYDDTLTNTSDYRAAMQNPIDAFQSIHRNSPAVERETLQELNTTLKDKLTPIVGEKMQQRFLHPLVRKQTISAIENSDLDMEYTIYTCMLELRQPEAQKSYALLSPNKNLEFFSHPVAHLLAHFESDNPLSPFFHESREWKDQKAFSHGAFRESLTRFTSLFSQEPCAVREQVQKDLESFITPRSLNEAQVQQKLRLTQGKNHSLLLSFDGEHLPNFDVHLHPLHLTIQTDIPSSLIIRLKRGNS